MKSKLLIRFAEETDVEDIVNLSALHAAYEKSDYNITGKVDRIAADFFGTNPPLFCLIAEVDQKPIGYATYMKQYATWDVEFYVYMDCLFVEEGYRGQGIGEKLVLKIKEEGLKLGCNLIQWQTPDFNTRAIKFYNRIGATSKSKERFFLDC